MEDLVDQGMNDGAWGLSTGLIYNPGTYAKTDELIALAKVAARHGGFYASHIRDEGTGVLAAIEEALTIGREAELAGPHLAPEGVGPAGLGQGRRRDRPDRHGPRRGPGRHRRPVSVHRQQHLAGGDRSCRRSSARDAAKDFLARLDDPEQGRGSARRSRRRLDGRDGGKALRIARYAAEAGLAGQGPGTPSPQRRRRRPLDIVLEIERHGGAQIVNFGMSEEDVRLIMKQPFVATASDGSSTVPATPCRTRAVTAASRARSAATPSRTRSSRWSSHPQRQRSAGRHPATAGARLPEDRATSPTWSSSIPKTFRDTATFDKPHQYATGVRYLFVNGQLAIDDGKYTGALAGKVLRHKNGGL